jgi:hypothetical protein
VYACWRDEDDALYRARSARQSCSCCHGSRLVGCGRSAVTQRRPRSAVEITAHRHPEGAPLGATTRDAISALSRPTDSLASDGNGLTRPRTDRKSGGPTVCIPVRLDLWPQYSELASASATRVVGRSEAEAERAPTRSSPASNASVSTRFKPTERHSELQTQDTSDGRGRFVPAPSRLWRVLHRTR